MKVSLSWIALIGAFVIAGCDKDEAMLPGKREDIRAVSTPVEPGSQNVIATTAPVLPQNRAMNISLPASRANANWLQEPVSPFARVQNPALRPTPQLIWSANIGSGDGSRNRITADPVVAGNAVFTLDSRATVTAVSTQGRVLWTRDLTPPYDASTDASGGGLAYANNLLYVTSGFGLLTALRPEDGAIVWQQNLRSTSSGAPSVRDGIVYLVSGDEIAWAIDTADGRVLWQLAATPDVDNVLGAPTPAISDKYAVFAFGQGDLMGAFRKGGLRLWETQVAGIRRGVSAALVTDVTGQPVIVGDRIYVGTHSGRTVAMNLADGGRIWTAQEGSLSNLEVIGGSVFFVSDKNELLRLSAADGERIWGVRLPLFTKSKPKKQSKIYAHHGPLMAGGQLVVASTDGYMRFFNPVSGSLSHTVEIPGGATTNPVVAGGTLYLVSTKGQLLAYR